MTMTSTEFFILAALVREPRDGRGIVGEVTARSEGRLRLRVGTLYGVISRMVADGRVEADHDEVVHARPRRYYRLTGAGTRALTDEAERQAAEGRPGSGWLSRQATSPARIVLTGGMG